jgi:hypothetical protein
MSRHSYARQKLSEALHSLVGAGPIQMRLTYAANYLIHLRRPQPSEIPPEIEDKFHAVIDALTTTPLSDASGYTPRRLTEQKGEEIAREILSMYEKITG